jgi:hypothetical protein
MAAPAGNSPAARYTPEPLVNLNSYDQRKRLSGSSLAAFFKIMELWNVRDEDAKLLLGGVSNGLFYEMKKNPKDKVLDVDQMYRISYLLGIFKAINILHGQQLADRWAQIRNDGPLFHGQKPLQYMIDGGLPTFQDVRRFLEGQIQGT